MGTTNNVDNVQQQDTTLKEKKKTIGNGEEERDKDHEDFVRQVFEGSPK